VEKQDLYKASIVTLREVLQEIEQPLDSTKSPLSDFFGALTTFISKGHLTCAMSKATFKTIHRLLKHASVLSFLRKNPDCANNLIETLMKTKFDSHDMEQEELALLLIQKIAIRCVKLLDVPGDLII